MNQFMSGAVGVAKFLTPQPILAEGQILYEIGSNRWQGNTVKPLVKNAARVNVYIAMRIALAGVLCYAFRHFQPDARIATVAGAAVSAPATALYWGGKCVFEGGKAALQNFKTPLTQEFGMGLGKYLLGVTILSYQHRCGETWKKGAVEWIVTKVFVTPGKYEGETY
ncbi:MAG: hypothetical protein KDK63_02010 [Chlamydiia bacterium]|nr:hypothetical protein [Chlamydiia bacterium]